MQILTGVSAWTKSTMRFQPRSCSPFHKPVQPGEMASIAVRPEDLAATDDGALVATVTATEFRGRDHTGFARMADGTELVFHSEHNAPPGSTVRLRPDPAHTLVFAG